MAFDGIVFTFPTTQYLKKITKGPFWIDADGTADSHALFRGHFHLSAKAAVTFRHLGASVYRIWLDGEILDEGPARFDVSYPEYLVARIELSAGDHVIAVHGHFHGVTTRLLNAEIPGFFMADLQAAEGEDIPVSWKGLAAGAYHKTRRRLGCVLGPVEWCDTRSLPADWVGLKFDDSMWGDVSGVDVGLGAIVDAGLGEIALRPRPLKKVAEGELVNQSPVDHDPPMNFVTRDLVVSDLPADGIWQRYDLGHVQLGRPRLRVKAPAGTLLQCAYAECLTHDRVSPYLKSGSGDNSCMMDTWILSGGTQTLEPLQAKGARFLEIHMVGNRASELAIESVEWTERSSYPDAPRGHFECGDELLNRIWSVGVETLRSCAEDAITDNPHRERGQWLGDAVGAGMDILAVSYPDWRPLERGLIQAARCAREDGLIPAVFPGTREYLPSFAIQWVAAVPHYYQIGGDGGLLRELYDYAVRNIASFESDREPLGLRTNPRHWNFIDWGYRGSATVFLEGKKDDADFDPALSLMYLGALRALASWAAWIGEDPSKWEAEAGGIAGRYTRHLGACAKGDPACWETLGFHTTALALAQKVVPDDSVPAAVAFLKKHLLACFPNNPGAQRLSGTSIESDQLITPFFLHHVLPILIEHGEMDFVLGQIRTCWGWALDRGLTTLPEVFDTRWSHCHQWSGCPTWILSRYALGLHPRYDLGRDVFELKLYPGDLDHATGCLPLYASDDRIEVVWKRTGGGEISFNLHSQRPIKLLLPDGRMIDTGGEWQADLTVSADGSATLATGEIGAPTRA